MTSGRTTLRRSTGRLSACLSAAVCLVSVGLSATASAEAPSRITVLVGQRAAPYAEVVEGLRAGLADQGVSLELDVHTFDGERPAKAVIDQVAAGDPTLVVTIGTEATRSVADHGPGLPQVAGLILDESDLAGATNATGVVLRFPFEVRLRWLARTLPGCETVGIIYDAGRNGLIADARRAARALGMHIEARPVRSAKEIPGALSSLSNTACAVLGVADPLVLTRQTAKAFLLFSFRNKIPFVGPSEPWVKAGALAALTWDYDDIGRQLAVLTERVIGGARPADIRPVTPRQAEIVVNKKTARHMKLDLPAGVMRDAHHVY